VISASSTTVDCICAATKKPIEVNNEKNAKARGTGSATGNVD